MTIKDPTLLPLPPLWARKLLSMKHFPLVLLSLSLLLLLVPATISILAVTGQRSRSNAATALHRNKPASRSAATHKPTPTPAPIQPFPQTFAAQLATLKAHDRFFYQGNFRLPEVALTFDDGPNPSFTPQILAILKHYHVQATFFDLGRLVELYPDLVRQEIADGHIVGDHTWSHPFLPGLSLNAIKAQIAQTSDAIQRVTGTRPIFFRPPYGSISSSVLTTINSFGMTTVIWDDEARDWSLPGTSVIVARILDLASNGAIILLHDGGGNRQQTVAALPTIIEQLQARHYHIVTLAQMVAHAHLSPEGNTTPTPTPSRHHHPQETPFLWQKPRQYI